MNVEACMWCKGRFPVLEGPVHAYIESTPGCWAAFGRVMAREYSDPELLDIHPLTVDAYAVQHPGQPSRKSIQSVALHLVRLCLVTEQGLADEAFKRAMLAAVSRKSEYCWLQPPSSLGELTIGDIEARADVRQHIAVVRRWAAQMWQVWAPHHETVRGWAAEALRTAWPKRAREST
jgi:hypothetical protein